jgi:hypothetical protein
MRRYFQAAAIALASFMEWIPAPIRCLMMVRVEENGHEDYFIRHHRSVGSDGVSASAASARTPDFLVAAWSTGQGS